MTKTLAVRINRTKAGRNLLLAAWFTLFISTASAQLVPDGQTNVLDAATNVVSSDLTVGTNGSFTLLSLTNAAEVDVSGDTFIGRETGSSSNVLNVTGVGTRLVSASNLYVGSNGWGNQLLITEAWVSNASTEIGYYALSSNNLVSVTGSNAVWTNSSTLVLGETGPSNALAISNGARVYCVSAVVGNKTNAKGNTVVIDNAFFTVKSNFSLGATSSFNQLIITNGGRITIAGGSSAFGSSPSSNNLVLIGGANSRFQHNSGGVILGSGSGGGNQMIVNDGGSFFNIGVQTLIGWNSRSNTVVVTGPSSKLQASGTTIGKGGTFNRLICSNGGTLTLTGSPNYVGDGFGSIVATYSNSVVISGSGSTCFVGPWGIGRSCGQNQVLVENGGFLQSISTYIGDTSGGTNFAIVTGSHSVWSNYSGAIVLGRTLGFNQLLVSNNASVWAANLTVGEGASATNNLVRNDHGSLSVINTNGNGTIDVRRGMLILNDGMINADRLVLTNGVTNKMVFASGTARTRGLTNSNGNTFVAGDGTNVATLFLEGTNGHTFTDGLLIQTNATLTGTGTINGSVTNCGTIFLTNADLLTFTGPVVNKGVILALTGTPRFGSTFTNLGTLITTASINVSDLAVSGADLVLQFNTVSNYVHEVQASTNVATGVWQSLTNGLLGTGSPMTYTDTGGATNGNRTYRVLLH